jgi:hypothetical protein
VIVEFNHASVSLIMWLRSLIARKVSRYQAFGELIAFGEFNASSECNHVSGENQCVRRSLTRQ